jgi:putative ABC transport system permease protein
MNADILISSSDTNTLADASPVPRQRMFEALSIPGVKSVVPVYFGRIDWKQNDGTIRVLDTFGISLEATTFNNAEIEAAKPLLALANHAIIDRGTRNVDKGLFAAIEGGKPYHFEAKGRELTVFDTFTIGGGFTADGYLIVSEQTFLSLFPQRSPGAPNHIFVRVADAASADKVVSALRAALPAFDTIVNTKAEAVRRDQAYQTTQRPVGIIFGFGVGIGILVGIIIVYQVLASDVADHLREYATMKAIGYPQRFFLGIVFEEALVLAVLGFLPGLAASMGVYAVVRQLAQLPIYMSVERAVVVMLGVILMCLISGIIATRKLARANPADLFP